MLWNVVDMGINVPSGISPANLLSAPGEFFSFPWGEGVRSFPLGDGVRSFPVGEGVQ